MATPFFMRNTFALYLSEMLYFNIAVENFHFMKDAQPHDDLCEYVPDVSFIEKLGLPFPLEYFLEKIASVCVLHDDAFLGANVPQGF